MSDFENEYDFNDEDFFNDHWSEKDWKLYLEKADLQVSLFLNLFVSSRNIVNHMDHIALQMGWSKETEGTFPDNFFRNKGSPDTIHTHPVTTITRGLYHFLAKNWEIFLDSSKTTDIKLCWLYAQLLNNGERNALFAISCMNAGDESLAVCHFKNALQILNFTMEVIQKIPKDTLKTNVIFNDALIACFDLREIWIKVMESCKNPDGDEDDNEDGP
ncbi:MAG: hypothetical protein LBS71_01425 [Puniceicoccales bacterium]|jgi:hypothetical protein|nr:hypothetical protein [Puniceicoccales bacterium]